MWSIAGKSLKGKSITLYTETSLEDYLVSSMLDIVTDKIDKEILQFIKLQDKLSDTYYLSVRVCTFNVIKYTSISE